MKSIINGILCLTIAASAASCGKTTKGKFSNDWKITSYEKTAYYHFDEDIYQNSTSANGTTYVTTSKAKINGEDQPESVSNGKINTHNFIIKKDGTWSSTTNVTYDGSTSPDIEETSGTWSFLKKTKGDDFGKRERVLFNILKVVTTSSVGTGGDVTNTQEYLTGEKVMIYTVKESGSQKLQLDYETDGTMVYDNHNNHTQVSISMTLEK